jgi:hypothetical protein
MVSPLSSFSKLQAFALLKAPLSSFIHLPQLNNEKLNMYVN